MARYRLTAAACLIGAALAFGGASADAQVPDGNMPGHNGGQFVPGQGGLHNGGLGHQHPNFGFRYPQFSSNFNSGWIQRPYPYHLDYYKMKYGGSYEPYMGNLYGPPIVNQFFSQPWPNFTGAFYW